MLGVYIIDFHGEHGEKAEKFKIIFIAIVARRASGEETGVSFNVSLPIATFDLPFLSTTAYDAVPNWTQNFN